MGFPRSAPLDIATLTGGRTVVVVAHPDDEVLGCGALLAHMRDVRVVHVTDGAPRSGTDQGRSGFASPAAYAAARRHEAEAALAIAGVRAGNVASLGIPDQEVSLNLHAVATALVPIVAGADIILTHAYEGGHSDHDAVAYAVAAACRLCRPDAERIEMPFYHADDGGWVRQRFLPQQGAGPERLVRLSEPEQAMKASMVEAHATQIDTLRSFSLEHERFRRAAARDFTERPHDGPLLYERHGWNLTWPDWQARVTVANVSLGLGDAPWL